MSQSEKLYCRGCGGILPVKANAGRIKCEFCGTVHLANTEQKREKGDLSCPNCGFGNPQAALYCGDCGKSLYHTCPRCGTQNPMEIMYCFKCGADIEKTSTEEGRKEINIEEIYMDYLKDGKRLMQEYSLASIPVAMLVIIGFGAGIYFMVSNILDSDNIGLGLLLFFGFTFLCVIPAIIIGVRNTKRVKDKAVLIAKNKPGFDKYFNRYLEREQVQGVSRDYWPQTVPDGIKRKEFLSMLGQK